MRSLHNGYQVSIRCPRFARPLELTYRRWLRRLVWTRALDRNFCKHPLVLEAAAFRKTFSIWCTFAKDLIYRKLLPTGNRSLTWTSIKRLDFLRRFVYSDDGHSCSCSDRFSVSYSFEPQIIECLFNTVSDKRIAIFGFAFKKNTGDTRETPAITVCKILLEEGAKLEIYDPKVESEQIFKDLTSASVTENPEYVRQAVRVQSNPYSAVERAHAIVVCTEWDDFQVILTDLLIRRNFAEHFTNSKILIFFFRLWTTTKSIIRWWNRRTYSTVVKYWIMMPCRRSAFTFRQLAKSWIELVFCGRLALFHKLIELVKLSGRWFVWMDLMFRIKSINERKNVRQTCK